MALTMRGRQVTVRASGDPPRCSPAANPRLSEDEDEQSQLDHHDKCDGHAVRAASAMRPRRRRHGGILGPVHETMRTSRSLGPGGDP